MGFIRTLGSTGLASEKMSHPLAGEAKKFVTSTGSKCFTGFTVINRL